jgi:hypothetical protein
MTFGKRQSPAGPASERRTKTRRATNVPAEIILPTGRAIPCRVVSVSEGGARLSVASVLGLPTAFELRAGGRVYRAYIVRRGIGSLAVRFR